MNAAPRRPGFRLFGIPVRIHASFFLMAAILGAERADLAGVSIWVAVVLASVLLHELGHAVAARGFGHRPRIELHAMGGTTVWGGAPVTPGRRLVVSLAGPGAGLVLGAAVFVALAVLPPAEKGDLVHLALRDLLWVNVGWGLLNLLPILPLDGWNVMASILDRVTGGNGERPARIVSFLLAAAALVAALAFREIWAALLAGFFAVGNLRATLEDFRRVKDAPLEAMLEAAGEKLSLRDVAGARRLAAEVQSRARTVETRAASAQLLALAHLAAGDVERARELLEGLPPGHVAPAVTVTVLLASGEERGVAEARAAFDRDEDGAFAAALARTLLLAGLLDEAAALFAGPRADALDPAILNELQTAFFFAGKLDASIRVGERTFARDRNGTSAYNVACALSRQGRAEEALGWLERALEAGLDAGADPATDPDLAAVRELPAYAARIAARIGGRGTSEPA